MRFVAGRGTVAERLQRGGAMAEHLLAGAPWRIAIGKLSLARGAAAELHREAATAGKVRRATAGKEGIATAGKGRYCWKGEPLLERRATARKVR